MSYLASRQRDYCAVDCPHCGCNASYLEAVGTGPTGAPWARYQCSNCHGKFHQGPQPQAPRNGVVDVPTRCPACGSIKCPTQRTRRLGDKKYRERTCGDCGQTFVSSGPAGN